MRWKKKDEGVWRLVTSSFLDFAILEELGPASFGATVIAYKKRKELSLRDMSLADAKTRVETTLRDLMQ